MNISLSPINRPKSSRKPVEKRNRARVQLKTLRDWYNHGSPSALPFSLGAWQVEEANALRD